MSAALTPRPPMPAAAGATQGMSAPPQGDVRQRFMAMAQGVQQLVEALARAPGVNQQVLQQARERLGEGMRLLMQALQSPGGAPPAAGAAPPVPTPSPRPPV
jgi:hypothetical protein